jgi:phosphoribosylformylglycinamidine (FGAM) synthase-like enzyme
LNPKVGAMHAVAEAARNVATSGARPIAATNCLNFGSPEKPEVMWQFSQAIDGIGEACTALGSPITGGNVSFYNETLGKSIYPTPVIGVLGILEDASKAMKIAFRNPGDVIVVLDGADEAERARGIAPLPAQEFSSSEYAKTVAGLVAGEPPAIDLAAEKRLIDCLVALAADGILVSAHDISDGGLAVTIAESCFASPNAVGAGLKADDSLAPEFAIFGERGARCGVSAARGKLAALRAIAGQYGVATSEIGQVTRDAVMRIEHRGRAIVDCPVESLGDIWGNSLERILVRG